MCRLLAFTAKGENLPKTKKLINAFMKASENDPYLNQITGGNSRSHNDGWGYALVGEWLNGGIHVLHYRSIKPVYEDLDGLYKLVNTLERVRWVTALLHSRKASREYGKTLNDVHPFHTVNHEGIDFWVAHNGSIDTQKLGSESSNFPKTRADTLVLTLYLSKFSVRRLEEKLKELLRNNVVKSALSLGILIMEAGKPPMLKVLNFNNYEGKDEVKAKYYRLYGYFEKSLMAIASSTVAENYGMPVKPLNNGDIVNLEIYSTEGNTELKYARKNILDH